MKKTLRSLFILALAAAPAFSAFADEAKRVIVVTTTTGFRHSSIAIAEKTLQKLADESKAYTIVDFVRQPDISDLSAFSGAVAKRCKGCDKRRIGNPLATPHGSMEGHYTFRDGEGRLFEVAIPFFPLAAPAEAS